MNINDHDKQLRLDEFIDALNAGDVLPESTDDDLAALFATAHDVSRLRAAAIQPPDVPTRLAAGLERELRASSTHTAVGSDSRMLPLPDLATASPIGRKPAMQRLDHSEPRHPKRLRQWAQFAAAAIAFLLVGVVLAQVLGGGDDDLDDNLAGVPFIGTPSPEATMPETTVTETGGTPEITPTVTLQAVVPDPTPSATATVEEPTGVPTPDDSGSYRVATFDEARALTEFDLVEPTSLPDGLTFGGLLLNTSPDLSMPGTIQVGPVNVVSAYYEHDLGGGFQFWQTTLHCSDPNMVNVTHEDIEIDGRIVRRSLGANQSGDPLGQYQWQVGEVCYMVFGLLRDGVDEPLLEAFVAAVPSPASPAVPFTPPFATLQVSPDYVTCDSTVTVSGANFDPGTVISIFGGPLPGDNFAPVVDEHPVNDDGSFEVGLDLSRLIGECGGGSNESEGSMFRLGASTGSSLVKGSIDNEGPSAMTVLTFSRQAPIAVRDRERLPLCGVEVLMNSASPSDGGQANQGGRNCFAAAVESGALAEFITHQTTVEGDIITAIYRTSGSRDVDVIVDATRDRYGSGLWQRGTCVWNEMSNLEPYTFHWESCDDPVPID